MGLGSVTFIGRSLRSLAERNSLRAGDECALIFSVTAKGTRTSIASSGRLPRKRMARADSVRLIPDMPFTNKSKKISRRISPSVTTSTPACSWIEIASATARSSISW
jgi:hypothetical protein